MNSQWSFRVLALFLLGMLSTGCLSVRVPEQTAKLRIRAFIDGANSFHIQGDTIQVRHHAYELPGRWRGANEPIYVNGDAWYPEWDGNVSSTYVGFGSALPKEPVTVSMAAYSATWGDVKIWQQPSAENDYTLTVSIDDRGPDGANWYTVDLDW